VDEDKPKESLAERIHNFMEHPQGVDALGVQLIILILIAVSVILAVVEVFYADIAAEYANLLNPLNKLILAAFTVEYLLRVLTAPRKAGYVVQPMNIIDFLAIAPNYVEILLHMTVDYSMMGLRGVRIIRFLRFARLIRGLRFMRFFDTLSRAFQYEETVFQAITPLIILVTVFKGVVWFFEIHGMWLTNSNLGDLFAIIGFVLGIILSQKIGVSYDKFIQVEEASVRIYANLQTLRLILNNFRPGTGTRVCGEWADAFLKTLTDAKADNYSIHPYNNRLYEAIAECEKAVPDQFWSLHTQLCGDASLCLSKKIRLTPKPYDLLLHQATVIYLLLIGIFIPGITGMISILVASYMLYGMYYLTRDLDSIVGGEFNLINIDLSELKFFAQECIKQTE